MSTARQSCMLVAPAVVAFSSAALARALGCAVRIRECATRVPGDVESCSFHFSCLASHHLCDGSCGSQNDGFGTLEPIPQRCDSAMPQHCVRVPQHFVHCVRELQHCVRERARALTRRLPQAPVRAGFRRLRRCCCCQFAAISHKCTHHKFLELNGRGSGGGGSVPSPTSPPTTGHRPSRSGTAAGGHRPRHRCERKMLFRPENALHLLACVPEQFSSTSLLINLSTT